MAGAAAIPAEIPDTLRGWLEREHGHFIGGEVVPSASGKTFETFNPANAEVLAEVAYGERAEVDQAVRAARDAFADSSEWRRMLPSARAECMLKLAGLLLANGEDLAHLEALDNGKPVKFARRVDVASSATYLRYFAGWITKIEGAVLPVDHPAMHAYTRLEPVGVCAQIIPWNFPLVIAIWKVAPALAAGCTIVLKPAEQTPLSALRLAELAIEAGFPPGVLNVVCGDGATGSLLVDHPDVDKIAFTGSTGVGREIAAKAGGALKRVTVELGGKSPNIILPDADLDSAVKGAFTGLYFNSGQVCSAGSRLLAPRDRLEEVAEGLTAQVAKAKVGPGLDPGTFIGPLVSAEQKSRVESYIEAGRAEAELVCGGTDVDSPGYFVSPTLFTTEDDDVSIVREEIFGPVLVLQPYESLDEVAERANAGEYGLAAGIWSRDISSVHRLAAKLRAGTIFVNGWGTSDPAAPFGGFKSSGFGRDHGQAGLMGYLEHKSVLINL